MSQCMSLIAGVVVTNTQTPLISCPLVAYKLILRLDTAAQNNTSKSALPPSLSHLPTVGLVVRVKLAWRPERDPCYSEWAVWVCVWHMHMCICRTDRQRKQEKEKITPFPRHTHTHTQEAILILRDPPQSKRWRSAIEPKKGRAGGRMEDERQRPAADCLWRVSPVLVSSGGPPSDRDLRA